MTPVTQRQRTCLRQATIFLAASLLVVMSTGYLMLRSGAALDAANWVHANTGSLRVANSIRRAIVVANHGHSLASSAYRWLVVSESDQRRLRTEGWAYAEHEAKYQSDEALSSAVRLVSYTLLTDHGASACIDFIEDSRRRWPQLTGENSVNWHYIWALVKNGQESRAVEVFEQDVLSHPDSEFRAFDKPTDYSIAAAYSNVDRFDEFLRNLRAVRNDHPKSLLAETIADYIKEDDNN